jgi:hypothetical protein
VEEIASKPFRNRHGQIYEKSNTRNPNARIVLITRNKIGVIVVMMVVSGMSALLRLKLV